LKRGASKNNGPPPSAGNNNSGVVGKNNANREYQKPWQGNAKKPNNGKDVKVEGE